jgi:hypothetical protein
MERRALTVTKHNLICHAGTGNTAVTSLLVELQPLPEGRLRLRYELTGDLTQLRLPAQQAPAAVDGLWEHSCFEAFIAVEGDSGYHEFNFSPSGQWAAYAFSDYRVRSDWTVSLAPTIRFTQTDGHLLLEAVIAAADLPPNRASQPFQLGLTAVIEANDGSRSYWALHHPEAHPDFHHRAGFILPFKK